MGSSKGSPLAFASRPGCGDLGGVVARLDPRQGLARPKEMNRAVERELVAVKAIQRRGDLETNTDG